MQDVLSVAYPWLKSLHIISVIAWMAGLLYLPRLFVYHCETTPGTAESERFKVMERKLMTLIMRPAMIATWILGLLVAFSLGAWSDGWLHAKLLFVVFLQVAHELQGGWMKAFAQDRNKHTPRFYRMVNEIPAVLMVAIVILVVVKPF